ncbi:hypothetical protein AA15973_2104 [Komagataeibacter sucrofermentans DSM 15973]|nr:hypothetical protein AA15973_2104 [Komagataeibacter sucrofermentans DSM 15973]
MPRPPARIGPDVKPLAIAEINAAFGQAQFAHLRGGGHIIGAQHEILRRILCEFATIKTLIIGMGRDRDGDGAKQASNQGGKADSRGA